MDADRTLVVGVNAFVAEEETRLPTLYIDDAVGEMQVASVAAIKASRDDARVAAALARCRTPRAATVPMEPILEAVRAHATVGEMCDALRDVWGEYEERTEF